MKKFIIGVYVDNQSGVLTRVSGMFTRRGFNIDSLTVGETECPEYSRITIAITGDDSTKDQLINQLRKLFNVKKVDVIEEGSSVRRELMLIKVRYDSATRADIITAAEVYRAKVVDYSPSEMCIEVTGEPSKIEAFIKLMIPFGVIEMCRTGVIALDRGGISLIGRD